MEGLADILKSILPAVVVLLMAYLFLRYWQRKENERQFGKTKKSLRKETLLLQLQAYERLILLLERITPVSMIMRLNAGSETALNLHVQLLATVRAEFEHNIAQQLYVSDEAWNMVKKAKEGIINNLNLSKAKIKDDESALYLVNDLMKDTDQKLKDLHSAIGFLKQEASSLFEK